jgi:hypothetical protein
VLFRSVGRCCDDRMNSPRGKGAVGVRSVECGAWVARAG